ncbi:MAG TPA: hypothetical protein VF753_00595 [Terriglobales bacterium]
MKKCVTSLLVLVFISTALVSCGSKSSTSHVSGFAYRAFVSNPLFPSGTGHVPVLNVVNAVNDALATTNIALSGNSTQPSIMALSPNLHYTAIFSQVGNTIAVVDNATEGLASLSTGGPVPPISLPGFTESFFISNDNATAYAAVPDAAIVGQAPGAVLVFNITTGGIKAAIPVPAARYVVGTADGTTLLVFSDQSDSVTVISTIFIGSNQNPVTAVVPGFDRPVWAVFNGVTAYVFNCGAECGGTSASIRMFVPGSSGPGKSVPVKGATYGMLNGSDLYVAGSPPGYRCSLGNCGTLVIVNTQSMAVVQSAVPIVDGYHNRMALSDDGQLFIGSYSCTNTNTTTGVPGCLSIYNTTNGVITTPTTPGNATGIQPIAGRTVVYVCQGGNFEIFSTLTDELLVQTTPTQIVGQSYDVKLVDPPPSPISPSPPNGN